MLKIKAFFRINGIILMLLGLFLFFQPELALRIVVIIFWIELLLSGGAGMAIARLQKDYPYRGILFFWSVVQTGFGLLLLVIPQLWELLMKILIILLWIASIAKGALTIFDGFKARDMQIGTRRVLLFMGGVAILFWIFLVSYSFLSLLFFNIILGVAITIFGIGLIISGFQLKEGEVKSIESDPSESLPIA